jgi:hypothetical protein
MKSTNTVAVSIQAVLPVSSAIVASTAVSKATVGTSAWVASCAMSIPGRHMATQKAHIQSVFFIIISVVVIKQA